MKTLLLYLALICGFLIPQGHQFSFLLRYLLMLLLLFAFIDIKFDKKLFHRNHILILLLNIALPVSVFFILMPIDNSIANAAFITAIAPTAIAAPVIVSLLKGRVEFAAFSLLLTNVVIALLIPFLIPALINTDVKISTTEILYPVLIILSVPLLTAQFLKYVLPNIHSYLLRHRDNSFFLLMGGIYLGTSKASNYLYNEMTASISLVFIIALMT